MKYTITALLFTIGISPFLQAQTTPSTPATNAASTTSATITATDTATVIDEDQNGTIKGKVITNDGQPASSVVATTPKRMLANVS